MKLTKEEKRSLISLANFTLPSIQHMLLKSGLFSIRPSSSKSLCLIGRRPIRMSMATGIAAIRSGTKMTTEKTSLFRRTSSHSLDMIVRMCFMGILVGRPLTIDDGR